VSLAPYLRDIKENLKHQYTVSFVLQPFDKPMLVPVRFATEITNEQIVAPAKEMVWPELPTGGGNR
jgi:hypothetical protein